MRKVMCMLLSAAMILSSNAWGDTSTTLNPKAVKAKKCFFPKSKKRAPVWICNAQADGLTVAAVGSAAKSQAGLAFMEQMAEADARSQLVQNVRGSTRKIIANEGKTAAPDNAFIAKISEESLSGTKIMKRTYGPDGTLYVLMGLNASDAQKLREAINAHN